jgi:hypothetical protein
MPTVTTPPQAAVALADDELTETAKATIIALIRQYPGYRRYPEAFEDIAVRVELLTPIQNKQINAALTIIDETGPGEVRIDRDEDATIYSKPDERLAMVGFIFTVLFGVPESRFGGEMDGSGTVLLRPVW